MQALKFMFKFSYINFINFFYYIIFLPMIKNLPKQIPVFPLSGVIYFPKTNLPLNIFEQRYLNLVNDTDKER